MSNTEEKKFVMNFNVGPSQLYDGVVGFYSEILERGIGSISHRSAQFTNISKSGLACARLFFNIPENYKIYYTYSATESMELVVRGVIEEKSIHVVNGNFGNVWYKTAVHNGRKTQKFENNTNENNRAENTRVELNNVIKNIESADTVCITGSETASGIGYSPDEISEFSEKIKNVSENILLAVDITSGMGGVNYDFSSADVWLFAVQKSLGLPAGLGFLVLSPKAYSRAQKIEEERKNEKRDFGNQHSIALLEKNMSEKYQTPSTPNVLAIAGFGYICKTWLEDFGNIDSLSKITDEKAELFYSFFESEKNTSDFSPAIDEKNARTKTVIVIKIKNSESLTEDEISKKMKKQTEKLQNAGFVIASGYGKLKTTQLRLANFPVHTIEDIENLLKLF
ncbi:TPA: aminotransferase class V-fold PLP-dependent enzyme [Candidatus Gracilibacteria bacterium]|nr:aminotransferase class V-fold PLP-dependent enzyme [Candidatus Gracilibacteria bacterium]